jgi:hypothetical protein
MDPTVGSTRNHELVLFAGRAQQVEQVAAHWPVWIIGIGPDAFAPALAEELAGQVFLQVFMDAAGKQVSDVVGVRRIGADDLIYFALEFFFFLFQFPKTADYRRDQRLLEFTKLFLGAVQNVAAVRGDLEAVGMMREAFYRRGRTMHKMLSEIPGVTSVTVVSRSGDQLVIHVEAGTLLAVSMSGKSWV